jgi:hypothetical protein
MSAIEIYRQPSIGLRPCAAIIALMMKTVVILFLVLMAPRVQAQTAIQRPTCSGVIRGVVFDQSGGKVRSIVVEAWPLGVGLSGNLPSVETDREGNYRFEHVCPGRYTVVVNDEKAGYPNASPMVNAFLYGSPTAEIALTVKNPEADLPVYLPSKPGLMQLRMTNQQTKAEIWKFRVTLKVLGQQGASEVSFSFDEAVKGHQIEVPPDKDVIYHVTADGFNEWSESAAEGKLIRVTSGAKATLEAELEPLK